MACVGRSGSPYCWLSTWSTPCEARRVLDAADPALVLTSDEFPGTTRFLVEAALQGAGSWTGAVWAWTTEGGDGDLAILYTSGSTGDPKGVRLGQGAIHDNAVAIVEQMGYRDGERVFSNFPLFFSGGLCNALSGVVALGGERVTRPRFQPVAAARLIRSRGCTARIIWREPDSGVDARSIGVACRRQLSACKVPTVTVLDELDFPLSASLKPDRLAARRLLSDA